MEGSKNKEYEWAIERLTSPTKPMADHLGEISKISHAEIYGGKEKVGEKFNFEADRSSTLGIEHLSLDRSKEGLGFRPVVDENGKLSYQGQLGEDELMEKLLERT